MRALLIGAAALFSIAPAIAADGYNLLAAPGGRYVYGWAGGTAKTAALLDTQTGRMWEIVCIVADSTALKPDCIRTEFRPFFFKKENGDLALTPDGKKVQPKDFE